jgi:hypothetical protein
VGEVDLELAWQMQRAAYTPPPADNADLDVIEALLAKVGALPISPLWTYSSIRHYERNCDWDKPDDGNVPARQCGYAIAGVVNALPALIAELRTLRTPNGAKR